MEDYQLGVPLKGKPLAESGGYAVYQEGDAMAVYSVWEEKGVRYGQHQGHLAHLALLPLWVKEFGLTA